MNLVRLYCNKADATIWELSEQLGLSVATLHLYGVGWDGEAWTIPSKNGFREVIGIQRRFPNGDKLWVTRSDGHGLFIPMMKSVEGNLFITEGWTDSACFTELGFRSLGRSNCETGVDFIKDFINDNPKLARITLVGDNDPDNVHGNVGQKGLVTLARNLYGQRVQIAVLDIPAAFKDARQWYTKGDMDEHKIIYGSRLI
jgi:hypothetical protein